MVLVEVKAQEQAGFASLYKWLEQDDAQMLICRADAKKRLYVIPEEVMVQFAKDMGVDVGLQSNKNRNRRRKR